MPSELASPAWRRESVPVAAAVPDDFVTRVIDSWEELERYRAGWSDLLDRAEFSTVFQTYEWHEAWWRAFGDGNRLHVVVCERRDTVVGIAPMMVRANGRNAAPAGTEICFIGCPNDASDYLDFIVDPAVPDVLDVLLARVADRRTVRLTHLPVHAPNYRRLIDTLSAAGRRFIVEPDQPAPCRLLGDGEADRKAASKASLRRRYNYFRKNGELSFQQCTDVDEILGWMDDFFRQHIERRSVTHAPSQFLDTRQQVFFRELVEPMLARGWLRFDVVLFDGRPLAFHYGFEYRNRFIWYKPTFNMEFQDRSPGEVLIKFLLEDAIDRELAEFDFTVGAEPFKYRFANEVRQNVRITVHGSWSGYWLHRARLRLRGMRQRLTTAWSRERRDD